MTCECFGVRKRTWLHLQEPGDAGQAAGWRQCPRFLHGDSSGGAGSSTCNQGKYATFDCTKENLYCRIHNLYGIYSKLDLLCLKGG